MVLRLLARLFNNPRGSRQDTQGLTSWLRKHPETLATSWCKWSKCGRVDLLQSARDLVMQEGIVMLRRGDFGNSNTALESIKDTSNPGDILDVFLKSRSNYGRTPLIAAARAGKLEAVRLLLSWVSPRR